MIAPLVTLARPHQWLKNGFVFIGLFFAHGWSDPALVAEVLLVFASFCLASSAVYVFNDVMDREADRAHPAKSARPVASGRVSAGAAGTYSAVLAGSALAVAAAASPAAIATAVAYMAVNVAYSLGLKHVPVLDVFLIAAGFMLRILAGTVGVGIEPSRWLLLCGLMITLFLGFAKRRAELVAVQAGGDSGAGKDANRGGYAQRRVLTAYSREVLDGMIFTTAAGTVLGYALYTIDPGTIAIHGTDRLLFTVPLVVYGIARYLWLLYREGVGEDPSVELLRDPHLVASFLGWLAATWWLIS